VVYDKIAKEMSSQKKQVISLLIPGSIMTRSLRIIFVESVRKSQSVSNSPESLFCLDALDEALSVSSPQIFHSGTG